MMELIPLGRIVAVFDSGEGWADRYRIVIELPNGERYALSTGDQGNEPNTVFMTCDVLAEYGVGNEWSITWDSLPEKVRRDVIRDIEFTLSLPDYSNNLPIERNEQ